MPRPTPPEALVCIAAGGLVAALALPGDAKLPVLVGPGAFLLAAVRAHAPEESSQGGQAPPIFAVAVAVAVVVVSGLLSNLPLPRSSGAVAWLAGAPAALAGSVGTRLRRPVRRLGRRRLAAGVGLASRRAPVAEERVDG